MVVTFVVGFKSYDGLKHVYIDFGARYMVVLWAFPTPQTIWIVMLDQIGIVGNCEAHKLSYEVFKLVMRYKNYNKRIKVKIILFLQLHKPVWMQWILNLNGVYISNT